MSRVCQVTGKGPVTGNNISHANNKTRRRFLPNLQHHRFWVEEEKRFVRLRVSAKGMRIIDKRGITVVLAEIRKAGKILWSFIMSDLIRLISILSGVVRLFLSVV